jgi:hypothetical protein
MGLSLHVLKGIAEAGFRGICMKAKLRSNEFQVGCKLVMQFGANHYQSVFSTLQPWKNYPKFGELFENGAITYVCKYEKI